MNPKGGEEKPTPLRGAVCVSRAAEKGASTRKEETQCQRPLSTQGLLCRTQPLASVAPHSGSPLQNMGFPEGGDFLTDMQRKPIKTPGVQEDCKKHKSQSSGSLRTPSRDARGLQGCGGSSPSLRNFPTEVQATPRECKTRPGYVRLKAL